MMQRLIVGVVVTGVVLAAAPGARAAAPVCTTPPTTSTAYGTPLFLSGSDYCTDSDGDTLTFEVVTAPTHGTLSGATGEGWFEYAPAAGFSGADSFAFKARDATAESSPVSIEITVEANRPPQCPPEFSFDAEPGPETAFDPAYWDDEEADSACSDPEYADLSFTVADPPAHGTLSDYDVFTGFRYRPAAGYSGADSFTFRASDGDAESGLVTVHINVLRPNHAPSCVSPVTLHVEPGHSVALGPVNRLLSCSDPDGDPLWPTLVSPPSHGTFSLTAGILSYTPNPGFEGTDEIGYRVSDPRGGVSDLSRVVIIVARATAGVSRPEPTPAPPTADTTAPVVRVRTAGRQTLGTLRRRGLRLVMTSNEACRVTVVVSVDRRNARLLRLRSRRLGSMARTLPAGRAVVVVRLTPKARKALRRANKLRLRLKVTATDTLGNSGTRASLVTLRR
jgi:Bacterial Ig domain